MALVGEFLATPARWYAPRIKWRLTQNSCSRSITNFGVETDPKRSMISPMNGEKANNARLLHVSPRFVELRQLLLALSKQQRAMSCPGNTTTRKGLLTRAPTILSGQAVSTSVNPSTFDRKEIKENLELFLENYE